MSVAVEPERIVRSDSAAVCVNTYHAVWRPARLILTEARLVCQQASKVMLSVPLYNIIEVWVVETRVILGLRRKALLVDTGKAKRLIAVKNPEEWRNQILGTAKALCWKPCQVQESSTTDGSAFLEQETPTWRSADVMAHR